MALFLIVFVPLFFITIACVGFGFAFLRSQQKQQIRKMLRRAASGGRKIEADLLLPEDEVDAVNQFLNRLHILSRLAKIFEQAGVDWSISKFFIITATLGLAGLGVGYFFLPARLPHAAAFVVGLLGAALPILNIQRKRRKKFAQFEEQFPEALDFLARSMRAGHAFSISLEMLVADSPEPLQSAFRAIVHDVQLGSSLDVALGKLADAIPLIDVRFFISSVILQQGTGGNLSEVMTSMANIIRERFQLKGQVKAAAAHGKVTGLVLSIMPIVVAAILFLVSPSYLFVLFSDPDGRKLLYGAIFGQILGYLAIKKIVNIKV